jgi:hypothetical protein
MASVFKFPKNAKRYTILFTDECGKRKKRRTNHSSPPRCDSTEVAALARLFQNDDRPTRILLGAEASEPALDLLATSAELARFGFIHLATHGVIDEAIPTRSAVILTQTGLPDPLEQALNHSPVFDGRLSVREIQRGWELNAELVTLSACETALGREAGGDDTATALLMQRFHANMLCRRPGLAAPMPKSEALREAKFWPRDLRRAEVLALTAQLSGGIERSKEATASAMNSERSREKSDPNAHRALPPSDRDKSLRRHRGGRSRSGPPQGAAKVRPKKGNPDAESGWALDGQGSGLSN